MRHFFFFSLYKNQSFYDQKIVRYDLPPAKGGNYKAIPVCVLTCECENAGPRTRHLCTPHLHVCMSPIQSEICSEFCSPDVWVFTFFPTQRKKWNEASSHVCNQYRPVISRRNLQTQDVVCTFEVERMMPRITTTSSNSKIMNFHSFRFNRLRFFFSAQHETNQGSTSH